MTSDLPLETSPSPVKYQSQIRLKNEGGKVLVILPTETQKQLDWETVWQDLKFRLQGDRSWQTVTVVHLIAQDQLLDGRQLQTLAQLLQEVQLRLEKICTSRRQTAVAAAMAGYSVEQELPNLASGLKPSPPETTEPLYLQATIRSGVEVRHPGSVVVIGDVNPGGSLIAAGDILVWGCLRGIAHAGVQGDRNAKIMALRMEPTQLRIASMVARAPETPPQEEAEVAYVTPEGIRIAKAHNFAKSLVLNS